jgi:putative spermidine/putrescine transport system permease protein
MWLGVAPFLLYAIAFLLYPSASLVLGAFQNESGQLTLSLVKSLFQHASLDAYWTSIRLSFLTAALGGLFGLLMAYAAVSEGSPRFIRPALTTFSGVAANFAGVPLAFAFIATIGVTGIVTGFLKDGLGVDVYNAGFSLYTFVGLSIVYLYFQIPLMILLIVPALDGIRREWGEAAEGLGATRRQYWRRVALPILMPSLLGATVILFGNAFGAFATAYALTSGQVNLVPILIAQSKIGNVFSDPHYGDALALGMVVVLTVSMGLYSVLQRRAARWSR